MPEDPSEIESAVHIDRAVSLEAMALLLHNTINEQQEKGQLVVSISHDVDHEDPDGKPFSYLLVTRTPLP